MHCPICNVTLLISNREGIEIDYCPKCRGVWLDRGELDKIIERATATMSPYRSDSPTYPKQPHPSQHHSPYPHDGRKKKREGFLSELFDFD